MAENGESVAKKEKEVKTVTMEDSRVVEFTGKTKMKKEGLVKEDGSLAMRFDFVNGAVRYYPLNPSLLSDFALHGAGQKYGDEVAGLKDEAGNPAEVEDVIEEIDQLHVRLMKGEWSTSREAGGAGSGSSLLLKALVEFSGQTTEAIREFLSSLSGKEKTALRQEEGVRQIIRKMEDEKIAAKGSTEAGKSILSKLQAGAASA